MAQVTGYVCEFERFWTDELDGRGTGEGVVFFADESRKVEDVNK